MNFDLLIIGGGINGTAIARDAAGRGLKVLLVEGDDLAQHTSSASSKLIHGGLRYLEHHEFKLVREALRERSILLRTAPHIVRPLLFVLPQGTRSRWMVRAGLALYDLFAIGGGLPPTRSAGREDRALLAPLANPGSGLLYWDARADDARLVVLNALDAAEHGAEIATRTALVSAQRHDGLWQARLSDGRTVAARMIVNAAGPWVADVLARRIGEPSQSRVRLIKGSHIVVPALFEGDHAYILQQPDGRVVFAIAWHDRFTLIGTTDVPVAEPADAKVSAGEVDYLCAAANRYFTRPISPADMVWSYAGIRALYDSGEASAQDVTRDYRLELEQAPGAKLLSVFGGKLTTARALAEEVMTMLRIDAPSWTAGCPLPGGDFEDLAALDAEADARWPWLPEGTRRRMTRAYGNRIALVLRGANALGDLGHHFGAGLTEAEIDYLIRHEWAGTAEDILWRRTKLGLDMTEAEHAAVAEFVGG